MERHGSESPSRQDTDTDARLDQFREAVNAQILRAHSSSGVVRRQSSLLKDSFSLTGGEERENSPSLSPRSSSPRSTSTSSSQQQRPPPRRLSVSIGPNVDPGDYPFPPMDSSSGSGDSTHPQPLPVRADSTTSDVTVRFRPSVAGSTPTTTRRPTYNSWSGPRDFPSPNIYDLTLKMNADIGMDSFWENLIEIFVLNFYASRVTLSMPYDQTDIHNTPWGLKATYNGSIDRQETRIKLERRQSTEAPRSLQSDSDSNQSSDSNDVTPRGELPPPPPGKQKPPARPVTTSIEEQLDSMLNVDHHGKTHSNLQSLDSEDEPLIDSYGVKRVLDRGSIVILSREYRDPQQIKHHEDEILATHEKELDDNQTTGTIKPESVKSSVLAAWEQTFFKPPETGTTTRRYEEYEQPFASPWSQSPAPSPAILKESTYSSFFQSVESAFSPEDDSDYTSTDAVYAIGMEDYRSIIHIPLVHPQTSKSITSESESSGSGGPRIVPVAIISFLSTVAPYPQHLITSLAAFAPLVATSLSLAIRHSSVLHQLAHGTNISLRHRLPHRPAESQEMKRTHHADLPSPGTQSSGSAENTNSDTSTPTWELHGRLFSPAVALAETPSPFRSTLSTETDYFSHRSYTNSQTTTFPSSTHGDFKDFRYSEDDVPPQSSSSHGTVSTEQEPMGKPSSPSKFRRKIRKIPRTIHSLGATSQFSGPPRSSSKKRTPTHRSESFAQSSDPYQMHTPSSRLLKVVVDSIPVHVFTAEPGTGTITWANGRTLAYRGVTAEAYIADPHASLHPDDSSEYLRRWKRMLKHETDGISQSVRIKRFDAQYRWFAARVVPLRDARGGVVHWFGTSMDIHDAREAEINSARQEEIKASEIKYRSLAEASPQIVFAATPALGISYANSQWMSYSGVTYDETSKLGFLSFVHPEDRERCTLPARGNARQYSLEIRLQSADKSYRWHLVKCIRIEERGPGKDEVWLGTCTDIHDHKMLEISLKKSHEAAKAAEAEHRKRAEDALETRRQQEFFIDMVSHELRNPLSAIVQSSDVVLNSLRGMFSEPTISAAMSHEVSDDIETMKSIGLCTMHMRRLIDDTINVSKLESGMLQVTPVDCQPTTIVKEIQLIFDAELQSKKIEMEIIEEKSYEDLGIEYVRADPSRISQILINLLSNAIKFLENRPERRITLVLGVSTTAPKLDATPLHSPDLESDFDSQDLYLLFSIHDTGPGLKKAEMAALFQRFSQATPRTHVTYGGSGLGLFISKRLVELQGGRIYVDSVEGKGSTFSFFIKVERSSMVSKQKTSPRTHATVPEANVISDGNQTHVLVVEDNLINQRLLKKQLVGSGYRVSVANHGREAVDKVLASQNSPKDLIHLVLMDVEMPILNGLQATRILREAEAKGELRKHIPVIAVSANAREEQKKRMFDAGADGYLTKPFQLPELVAKLREQTEPKL